MQIKIFIVPATGNENANEEMNVFLRSHKILQVENHFVDGNGGAYWSFCVKYIDDKAAAEREKPKVDYRKVLDEPTFQRFSALRAIRKKIALEENIPAYLVFHDNELAELAKMEQITAANMKTVKGIGEKKIEKFGHFFIKNQENEALENPN